MVVLMWMFLQMLMEDQEVVVVVVVVVVGGDLWVLSVVRQYQLDSQ